MTLMVLNLDFILWEEGEEEEEEEEGGGGKEEERGRINGF